VINSEDASEAKLKEKSINENVHEEKLELQIKTNYKFCHFISDIPYICGITEII
jgi:hypothetical protein